MFILSYLRAFTSKYKLSLLNLYIMDVFLSLKDHYCKFFNSHKQYWTWLKRLPGFQICYNTQRTLHWVYIYIYIAPINTSSSQININCMFLQWKLHQLCNSKDDGQRIVGQICFHLHLLHAAKYGAVFFNPVNLYTGSVRGLTAWARKKHLWCCHIHMSSEYMQK